jgi:hypothetical protein
MNRDALWRPSAERIAAARLGSFMAAVNSRWRVGCSDYASVVLHS